MRVGIIGLQHESNTFIRTPTTLDKFREEVVVTGPEVRTFYGHTPHEIGGFFEGLEHEGIEPVPIFAASAYPSGTITAETVDQLLATMLPALEQAGKLDGLLVAPHGAGVSEKERDLDGYWLSEVRQRIGPDIPMICTIDPHANVSRRMIEACDATIAYRSNPHLDQHQRGLEAARLMARTLRGEIRPTQAVATPPVAINIERQYTQAPPCKPMYALADDMLQRPGVLSNSVVLGFPYADVEEMGSGFIVVTDDDPALAQTLADALATWLVEHRHDFVAHLIEVDEAIDQAEQAQGTVCLLDMGDNVGGGSAADGTFIAQAILRRQGPRTFVALYDPEAAEQAIQAGAGQPVDLKVGGKTDDQHGPTLAVSGTVRSVHDGQFTEARTRHGGKTGYNMGPTAIIDTPAGLTLQLTSRRVVPFSLGQITSCGLDPHSFKILVAKGVNAPVAAYEEICETFIRVNTAGSTSADMDKFTYRHRRRPLFPFEEIG